MLKGEKRIKAIERDIGRQVVGRAWDNIQGRKEINKKDFNKMVGRTIRFDKETSKQILDVLRSDGKIRITQRRIKLL